MTTILLFCATSLPDFSSMVYQPVKSRPLSSDTQPSAPACGKALEDVELCAKPLCGSQSGLAAMDTPAFTKFRRLIMLFPSCFCSLRKRVPLHPAPFYRELL